jgi:hypothetical protein
VSVEAKASRGNLTTRVRSTRAINVYSRGKVCARCVPIRHIAHARNGTQVGIVCSVAVGVDRDLTVDQPTSCRPVSIQARHTSKRLFVRQVAHTVWIIRIVIVSALVISEKVGSKRNEWIACNLCAILSVIGSVAVKIDFVQSLIQLVPDAPDWTVV